MMKLEKWGFEFQRGASEQGGCGVEGIQDWCNQLNDNEGYPLELNQSKRDTWPHDMCG